MAAKPPPGSRRRLQLNSRRDYVLALFNFQDQAWSADRTRRRMGGRQNVQRGASGSTTV